MCGKPKEITPYDNHNLGTATICRVENDYAETPSFYMDKKFNEIRMEQETAKMFISDLKETVDLQEKFVVEV